MDKENNNKFEYTKKELKKVTHDSLFKFAFKKTQNALALIKDTLSEDIKKILNFNTLCFLIMLYGLFLICFMNFQNFYTFIKS